MSLLLFLRPAAGHALRPLVATTGRGYSRALVTASGQTTATVLSDGSGKAQAR